MTVRAHRPVPSPPRTERCPNCEADGHQEPFVCYSYTLIGLKSGRRALLCNACGFHGALPAEYDPLCEGKRPVDYVHWKGMTQA